jgi:hypothetical protein
MDALARSNMPMGMSATAFAQYQTALSALVDGGVDVTQLAGLTVFRTGDPVSLMGTMRDAILALPTPHIDAPWVPHEIFTDYCVYQTTIHMPDYQGGTPPFSATGGAWVFDASGHPMVQRMEQANLVVTVPRHPMPTNGYPTAVFIRTGGGGDRPLVDRGVQAVHNGPPLVPGTGPAMYFARAGFAGLQVDGPLGGSRNTTMADEQFTVFNVANPFALRDNVRESALEIILLAHILDGLTVDASACPGVGGSAPVHFDTSTLALMGHSMGATIAPLTLAFEPRYRAAVLSGAGGSWIENVVYKQSPVPVRMPLELILHYSGAGRMLAENDAALSLLQWAGEGADPPVYARYIIQEPRLGTPRNVLMVQGIVDTYILPPIANSTSLSLGLDFGGPEIDGTTPALSMFTPIGQLLDLSGRHTVMLPVQSNEGTSGMTSTGVVVQAMQDMVEDGHEVAFQTEGPKHQYLCFLQSFASGAARVPPAAGQFDPCP